MATKQQAATKPVDARPVLSDTDVTAFLVKARTMFDTVVRQDALPLVWESELGYARKIVQGDPTGKLRWVVPETLQSVLENTAQVGLTLNPLKQHGTIIARYNEKLSVYEAAFLPMYRGLVYLGTQAGVHDIVADVVYKADVFKIGRTSEGDYFEHSIDTDTARGDGTNFFKGAYVSARMPKTGERKLEWVPAEDIYKMRDASESYRDQNGQLSAWAPWIRWFDEQAKKGALKRATKRWEEGVDGDTRWQRLQAAVRMDHHAEGGGRTFEGSAQPIDVPKLTMEQITAIEGKATELYSEVAAQKHFLTKICNAYGREALSELSAQHYQEVLDRIEAARQAILKKRAKGDKPPGAK